jgi:adenylylsulfate kinase
MVIWIIGLSGAGKTALAELVVGKLRAKGKTVVLVDGDVIRRLFGNDVDHTLDGRRRNAERISNITKFLSDQGVHVVCAVLSIFPEWRKWNRENMRDYAEVYLRVSMETLIERDIKNLYKRALSGEINNVVGVDLPFPEPDNPELTIENDEKRTDFTAFVDQVMDLDVVRRAN